MNHLLQDNQEILVEVEGDGNLTAWVMQPAAKDGRWPVRRPLPGMPAFRSTGYQPILELARWMIVACCEGEDIERFDFALTQERLSREHSCIWSIPVVTICRFVAERRTALLAAAR